MTGLSISHAELEDFACRLARLLRCAEQGQLDLSPLQATLLQGALVAIGALIEDTDPIDLIHRLEGPPSS